MASNAGMSVFTPDAQSRPEIEVLCEELQRQIPRSIVLAIALVLRELRWIRNQEEVLFRLEEKDIEKAILFVCEQGWRELHRMPFTQVWQGIPFEHFFTDKPLVSMF